MLCRDKCSLNTFFYKYDINEKASVRYTACSFSVNGKKKLSEKSNKRLEYQFISLQGQKIVAQVLHAKHKTVLILVELAFYQHSSTSNPIQGE